MESTSITMNILVVKNQFNNITMDEIRLFSRNQDTIINLVSTIPFYFSEWYLNNITAYSTDSSTSIYNYDWL